MRPTSPLRRSAILGLAIGGLSTAGLLACAPTVKIEAPDKPIEINLNIRIEQEVRVKVERDLDKAIADDPALFGVPPAGAVKGGKTP
ncbi:YnbE family lipoprotein [Azospirillum rugosum]|uniref:YnbE-like lipoprotein n=1 Tax=Azospirillum rugosum TaxID=416170 RepID=A0ABS4SDX4_9PROT|nr:YnbE family lipoprotein [Azospirillum rugosum]MBP2290600.1 hypothetical protein [Azospirillum rugosum]MDQ0525488.1 hypothetical protein [Azospirillum rugosum]